MALGMQIGVDDKTQLAGKKPWADEDPPINFARWPASPSESNFISETFVKNTKF